MSYMTSLSLESLNGPIRFRLRGREKSMNVLRGLKMMKSLGGNLMLKKRFFNKNHVKGNLIRLRRFFMIIRIWLRLCTVKC